VRIRPLAELTHHDLKALLQEEADHWQDELLWDFRDVSGAVANSLDRGDLVGRVAEDGIRRVGYAFFLRESGRAIVGSAFASEGYRGTGLEESLLDDLLSEALISHSYERVECQTLFSTAPASAACFQRRGFKGRSRHYMVLDLARPVAAPSSPPDIRLRHIRREDLDAVSGVIYESHVGSVDAALNLTYSTPIQCRSFVDTIVLRAGCGRFDPDSSVVAESADGIVGVVLGSRLSRSNGHVCQVSIRRARQGSGLGSMLVLRALESFRRQGLRWASLSVTVDNFRAHRLYRRLGFGLRKEFAAWAWARPPLRVDIPS
jgi:GNAT superfamily N-acetyltransferase